jgi:predicted ester cyclase
LFFKERDVLIDNDRAALVMTVEGTHAGDFFGLPASGRRVKFVCAFVYTLRDGQIIHERRILDFTGVLVQVGVIRAKPAVG